MKSAISHLFPIARRFVLLAILSVGFVSGALAGNPASDLTVTVQELENGDIEFSLSGTAYYKQQSGYPFRTATDSNTMEPPHTLDNYEYFTIPDGLTLTVPNNDPMPVSPTNEATLRYLEFSSSGYWSFYSFSTGMLFYGDALVGSGSVITDVVPFENFEPGTYVVEGDDFDTIYKVLPYAPPKPAEVKAPSSKNFPTTRVRRTSRNVNVRVRNVGEESVEGLRARITGRSSRDFRLRKRPGSTIAAGKSTIMRLIYRPRSAGRSRAVVLLISNASTERLTLKGRALRPAPNAPRFPEFN